MPAFAIDTDNNITAFAAAAQVPEGQERFTSQKELAKLSSDWPITRFAEVWNSFAGVPPFGDLKPLKKFKDRPTAVTRIWSVIQVLTQDLLRESIREAEAKLKAARTAPAPAQDAAPVAPKKAKAAKRATGKDAAPTARASSKKAIVLDMLNRPDGATLDSIVATTGWQKKTVYGFISGTIGKKMGLTVDSIRSNEGVRSYRLVK